MTTAERNEIRGNIEKEIETIKRSIETLLELTESELQSDANDWFSSKDSNSSKEINEQAIIKGKKKIMVLTDLLKRVDRPEFGICVECNNPIAFERIKAVPTAIRCVSCS